MRETEKNENENEKMKDGRMEEWKNGREKKKWGRGSVMVCMKRN